jgi:recombination protein RecA
MGDSHVGLQARLMSQALRKITGALSQTKTTAIFINQLREKVGVMFGSPETTSGGRALKFYASVRLDVRRIETLKDGTEAVGSRTRIKVVKNKCSPPFKVAECDIIFGIGISREGGLIDLGVEQSIVRKSGAWYTYEGDQLGQGKENSRNFLRDNPDLANEIEKKIKEKLGVGPRVDAEAAPAAGAGANGSAANGSPVNGSPANGSAAGGPVAGAPVGRAAGAGRAATARGAGAPAGVSGGA